MSAPPTHFGPYELIRPLGVGGMAETHVANRSGPGGFEQRVCLKRVLPAFNRDPRFVEQFLQEARLAASLRHANIVGVIDFGEQDGTYYMALELVEGCDLRQLIMNQPNQQLPVALAMQVGIDLAYALDYAHNAELTGDTQGIVHRDLSPSNVLLSRSGGVQLADFGIAKAMRGMSATASTIVKGKIPYMAPEQMRGEPLDGRADLFSLGVILWELLVGSRPFDGKNDVDTMGRIVSGQRPSLSQRIPELDRGLVATIERLIHVDKEQRFASAEALVDALAEVGGSPAAKREIGRLVCAINPKPDRTTGPMAARPSDPDKAAIGAARTTPLDGSPSPGSGAWDQTTQTTPEESNPGAAPMNRGPLPTPSGGFDHWSSPGKTGGQPPDATRRGLSTVTTVGLTLTAVLLVVGGTLGVQNLLNPSPAEPAPPLTGGGIAVPVTDVGARPAPPHPQPPITPQPLIPQPLIPQPLTPQTPGAAEAGEDATDEGLEDDAVARIESVIRRPETDRPADPGITMGSSTPHTQETATTGSGRLRVTVAPWGDFSVDGRPRGRAPQTLTLRAGRHTVTAHTEGEPPQTRRVIVRQGQLATVHFRRR